MKLGTVGPDRSRALAVLYHAFSPAPLIAAVMGVWFPLEWILAYGTLRGASPLEAGYILASSALCNYLPGAAAAYVLICLAATVLHLFGSQAARTVRVLVDASSVLVLGLVAFLILIRLFTPSALIAWCTAGTVMTTIGILAARSSLPSRSIMEAPFWLSVGLLPGSLALVLMQVMGVGLPAPLRAPVGRLRPDILFITVDALSARPMSLYGAQHPTCPNLEALAGSAITVDHFYANGNWTRPGIASLLNGTRPWTHLGDLGTPRREVVDSLNFVRQLALAGYEVRGVSNSGFLSPSSQNLIGVFQDARGSGNWLLDHGLSALRNRLPFLSQGLWVGPAAVASFFRYQWLAKGIPDRTTAPLQEAKRLMSLPSERPKFVWLHLMSVHAPYLAPPPWLGSMQPSPLARTARDATPPGGFGAQADPNFPGIYLGRYEEAILALDAGLGQMFAWMKSRNLFDPTVIVFTADHGDSFRQGFALHGGPMLNEDQIWIPCIIKPSFHTGGRRITELREQADLAPTVLDLVGLAAPPGMEGRSMLGNTEVKPIFSMNHDFSSGAPTFTVAVRQGDWKYTERFGQWKSSWPKQELYNLASDPSEEHNLVKMDPVQENQLRSLLQNELNKHNIGSIVH